MTEQSLKLENIEKNSELFRLYLTRTESFISESINKLESTLSKHEDGEWAHASIYEMITKHLEPPEESVQAYIELESVELFPFLLRESFFCYGLWLPRSFSNECV